jgi:hypothetical protein
MGHVLRFSGLLRLEASQARVSQSSLKTGGGVAWMVNVESLRRSHGDEIEDRWVDATGYIGLFYPNFAVFIILCHKGSLVISFPLNRTPRDGGEDQTFIYPSPTP